MLLQKKYLEFNVTWEAGFSLINSEMVKSVIWYFAAFPGILVFLTCPNLQILGKTQTRVFPIFEFLINP